MLRIGEFSSLTGISIYMLRNYDKIGLIVPEYTDEANSYRYYGESQIVLANQIQVLKRLGFGLKEIIKISNSEEKIKFFIQDKVEEKKEEIARMQKQIEQMEQALTDLDNGDECALAVVLKTMPARKVASYRGVIHRFDEEGLLWSALGEICGGKVRFSAVDYSFAITHAIDLEKSLIDVEVQRVVEKKERDTDNVKFKEIPECMAATVAFQGQYSKLENINHYMAEWVKKNGYQINGLSFSTYYISPGNEQNSDNFITEVCFPIEKINLK